MTQTKTIRKLLGIGLVLAFLLAACENLPFELPWLEEVQPTATQSADPGEDLTSTPELTITVEPTPQPVTSLTVWVPPEMDPSLETESSLTFVNRLQMFSDLHDGLEINVRVKAASGAGGLLDSLTATSSAAPDALPDLIAFTRSDMENAALKGLIYPLESFTQIPDDSDWYGFTRDMALWQGSTYGLPFAADALVLVYRPEIIPEFPNTWTELLEAPAPLAFPADSDQSLFTLALYEAEGGAIQDNQRRPMLEVQPLTEVYRLFQEGVEAGLFSPDLVQYQTTSQVWAAFRDGQTNLVVTWLSEFLKSMPADATVVPLFAMAEGSVSIGTGWSWTVAAPSTNRQELAVDLAEFLAAPEFISEWTATAGYLPARPSSLEGWQSQSLRSTVGQVALMTRLRPSNDIIGSLGPIMRESTRQVLQGMVDPAQAAQVAVESL